MACENQKGTIDLWGKILLKTAKVPRSNRGETLGEINMFKINPKTGSVARW